METLSAIEKITQVFSANKITLYAVGGFVRNKLLGINYDDGDDVDLCSNCTPEQLKSMFSGTEFKVEDKSFGLGVCLISSNEFKCEHATFRTETYNHAGEHTPNSIAFTNDIKQDALRRDFTCNCVYLNLQTGEYFDPFGGIADIKNKVIRTIVSPKIVFNDDGLRILRMVRFACALGFSIDEETYETAKRNVVRTSLVSKSLIRKEFDKILISDTFYPTLPKTKSAHVRGVTFLGDLRLWKYIFPAIAELQESGIVTARKHESVYEHCLRAVQFAPSKYRLPALLHDIGMLKNKDAQKPKGNMAEISANLIPEKIEQAGLDYSASYINWVQRIIELCGYDENKKMSKMQLREFILKNRDVIEDVINLKIATIKAITFKIDVSTVDCDLQREYAFMQAKNIPTCIKELTINGQEIIELYPQLNKEKIGVILNKLLTDCALHNYPNKKENLLKLLKNIISKM